MLLAAYVLFAVGVRLALREGTALRRVWLVRSTTATLALLLAFAAVARLLHVLGSSELSWERERLAYLLPAAIAFGGVTYAIATWFTGAAALAVRRTGWAAMTSALVVPSTFTLALPLLAPLALTLGSAPRTPARAQNV
jgi:hypothetical protein